MRAAIDAMRTEAADVERLAFESAVMGDLAGQMFVRLVEGGAPPEPIALAVDPDASFLSLPFDEAIDWWIRKGGSRSTLDEVLRAWRKRSALAASMQFDTVSQSAIAAIEKTLAEGGTLRDFQRAMETEAITLGISPAGAGYLENVYRTNVATAYGAGRFAQLNDPALLSARPYRQWRTAGDSRVRAEHAVMRGVTWRVGNPAFEGVATPGSWRCRCVTVSYSQADVDEEGIAIADAPPSGFFIEPGFGAAAFAR